MRPSKRKIAQAHLATSARGARLLAAAGGDAEHAARIDRTLDELRAHSRPPAPLEAEVIRLPQRPYDRELDGLADVDVDEQRLAPLASWLVAGALGLLGWAIVVGAAFGLYALVEALR